MSKPIAYDFDTSRRNCANLPNPGGYAVIYKCASCGTKLCDWLADKEKYCHTCGEPLSWGVITYINSRQSDKINEKPDSIYKTGLLAIINSRNAELNVSEPVFIKEDNK